MFQIIQGQTVFVVDLPELPELPITDGGVPEMKPYAEALESAIRDGIVTKPGKYAIRISTLLDLTGYEISAIKE